MTQTYRKICSWIERIHIAKMTILTKAIHKFDAILIKVSMAFFIDLEQIILKPI